MKILYFCTCWLPDLDRVVMLQSWLRVARQQNADIRLIDTTSRFNPVLSGIDVKYEEVVGIGGNIGHGSRIGDQDGWGRAFCKGIELAITGGYDYAVHVESDMACRVDCRDVIALIRASGKPFAAPYCSQVQNIETGLMYMDVNRLQEMEFVNRYNWPKIRPEMSIEERIVLQPEKVIGGIFGEEWLRTNWLGGRFEYRADIEQLWFQDIGLSRRIQYFTHVRPWAYDLYTRDAKGEPLPLIRL